MRGKRKEEKEKEKKGGGGVCAQEGSGDFIMLNVELCDSSNYALLVIFYYVSYLKSTC